VVIKSRFAGSIDRLPAAARARFYFAIGQAMARNLKPATYATLGASAALAAGVVLTRRFHPAPITAVVEAVRRDAQLREAYYFIRISRASERKDRTR
jgi:uncharacterized membrane protein